MRRSIKPGKSEHPEIHVVAGCAVVGTEADGREIVERIAVGQQPMFWGHYRVAADGRQLWLADYDGREVALEAARSEAGRRPVYVEENGSLIFVSGKALPPHRA